MGTLDKKLNESSKKNIYISEEGNDEDDDYDDGESDEESYIVIPKAEDEISKEDEKRIALQELQKLKTQRGYLIVGYVASVFSIATWLPQVVETFTNPDYVQYLNRWLYLTALVTQTLWIVFAAGTMTIPLLISSSAVVVMLIIILVQIFLAPIPQAPTIA